MSERFVVRCCLKPGAGLYRTGVSRHCSRARGTVGRRWACICPRLRWRSSTEM